MELTFLILTLFLIALPFLFLFPVYFNARSKSDEQLASIKPLLFQWGFQRVSWLEQATEQFLYKNAKHAYPIYISLKSLPHGNANTALTFLVFWVELPLSGHFFLRPDGMESEENDILYETYWNRLPSHALAPLGLRALFPTANRADLERRFLSEPVQRVLTDLIAQRDLFYIYGDAEHGSLQLGFALPRSPEPQRVRRWFDTVVGLMPILNAPERQGQVKRNKYLIWIFLVSVFLCILGITLFSFVRMMAGA